MIAAPVRLALDYGERPDPGKGIFETLLVERGVLPMRAAHYARMNASARELYGVEQAAPDLPRASLPAGCLSGWSRMTYVPAKGLRFDQGPPRPYPAYDGIAPFILPGGLGRHKWADRSLVDALNDAAGAALPLLIDVDGSVLESTWANVLIDEGGRLIAPPHDGRALPGIGRSRLRYDQEPVDLDRLLAADAVVLTSALRTVRCASAG